MAHSYDHTLIQCMGFADPDRRSPAHDDACIQIATDPERFLRAVRELRFMRNARCELEVPLQKGEGKYASTVGFIDAMVTFATAGEDYSINAPRHFCSMGRSHRECQERRSLKAEHVEAMAQYGKGAQEYIKSHIVPSWIQAQLLGTWEDDHINCEDPIPVVGPANLIWGYGAVLVEVKTTIDNLGFLLRQMNLYREYKRTHGGRYHGDPHALTISSYVIWSLDPADSSFATLLAQQGYHLIAGPLP